MITLLVLAASAALFVIAAPFATKMMSTDKPETGEMVFGTLIGAFVAVVFCFLAFIIVSSCPLPSETQEHEYSSAEVVFYSHSNKSVTVNGDGEEFEIPCSEIAVSGEKTEALKMKRIDTYTPLTFLHSRTYVISFPEDLTTAESFLLANVDRESEEQE